MKNNFLLLFCMLLCLGGCNPAGDDANANEGDLTADTQSSISEPTWRKMNLATGGYDNEAISDVEYLHVDNRQNESEIENWTIGMGDILFFRGQLLDSNEAIVPQGVENFYWNGACLISHEYSGGQLWCYMPVWTSVGWQIYKRDPARLAKYCVVAHLDYSGGGQFPNLPQMIENLKNYRWSQGGISKAGLEKTMMTTSGLLWKYFDALQIGFEEPSGDYIMLEDFISKSDGSGDEYFESVNPYFVVRDVLINPGCEEVW